MSGSIRLEPDSQLEIIVDRAMTKIEEDAREEGGEIRQIVVICYADGLGVQDTVTAGNGFEDPTEVLAFLLSEIQVIARQLGLNMNVEAVPPPENYMNQDEIE